MMVSSVVRSLSKTWKYQGSARRAAAVATQPPLVHDGEYVSEASGVSPGDQVALGGHQVSTYASGGDESGSQLDPLLLDEMVADTGWTRQ